MRAWHVRLVRAHVQHAGFDLIAACALPRCLHRDTPKGKPCECTLHVARASLVTLPPAAASDGGDAAAPRVRCLAVELVGDRFLRRMVRVLVATALREATAIDSPHEDRLGALVAAADRRATAAPAPALGLCFASVGYGRGAG